MASNPTAAPGTIVVTLPPGITTAEQFASLQHNVVAVAIAMACAVALVCWDFLVLLPQELELYRSQHKRHWKGPGTWAFLVLRYAGPFALIPGLFFTSLQNKHCQVAASLGEVGVILVTGSAGIIFCYRVFSLWNHNKIVKVGVSTLWLFSIGCWIAVATQLRATEGPPTAFGSNCKLHPEPAWAPLNFASTVLFDTTILVLTIIRLKDERKSSLSGRILWDNIAYFIIVTAVNIVVLVIQSLQGEQYQMLKPVSLPFPTLITSAMGCRVFLNLRLFHSRRDPTDLGDSFQMGLGTDTLRNTSHSTNHSVPLKGVMVIESSYVHTDAKGGIASDAGSFA